MAKQLPKYEQQLKPVADTTALKRDPNLTAQAELAEGAVDAAYASGFASVAKVGAEIAFKVRDTHNDTQRALAAKELEAILAEYPKEAEKQAKEEDLEILKEGVLDRTKKVQEKYENNIYGNKAKKQLGAMGQSTILSIDAIDETAKQGLVDREYAGVLYGMIHDAQDKRKPIPFNPKTGLPFESEILEYEFNEETQEFSEISISGKTEPVSARQKAYNYAVRELQLLGEINNKQAATMINEYGYKTNYMSVINEAMINPDEALVLLNDLDMSAEQQIQATKIIQAQIVKRDNEIEKIKTDTADDVNEAIKKDELNYEELAEINEEQTVLGKTFKPLTEEQMKVADIKLTSDINTQISASPTEYKAVQNAIRKIAQEVANSDYGRPSSDSLKEFYKALSQTKQKSPTGLETIDKRKDLKLGEPIFNRLFIQTHEQIVQEIINGHQNNPNYISSFEYGSDIITTTMGKYFDSAAEKKDFPLITTEIGNKQVAFAQWLATFESEKGQKATINDINKYMENELLSYMSSNAYDDVIKKLQKDYGTGYVTANVGEEQIEYESIMDMPIDDLVSAIQMDFNETPYVIDEATRYLKEIQ
tara:strand:- start:1481 stop:3259 length:1779 start_codon:yes stop_codon:yes gene_type:complete